MRKIEKEMLNAVNTGTNWAKANTQVVHINGIAQVFLHGNHIASIYGEPEANVETLKAWPSRTTQSRLWALGINVYQRKGLVYLNDEPVAEAW
jgi:hypothetical protein